ncbi:MAG: hypothetical protein AMS27_10195 [Bacteroides sp. SM23_62_1]|nr:MAG: hypothetical protein AMS27_10195 [Bacteroides sp. SM23_62_1]
MKYLNLSRRNFLKKSSFSFLGAGILGNKTLINTGSPDDDSPPKIKEYRTLGRTGFKVSDIGCGPVEIPHENMLKYLIRSGINLIDTSAFYENGNNERMVGKAIKDFKRESLFINTKIIVRKDDTKENIVEKVRTSLDRLQTSYIDGLMLGIVNSSEEVKNEKFHEAMEQLKQEGRVKYCGVACHGSSWTEDYEESMEEVLFSALDDSRYDLLLLVYNFVQKEMGENILKVCRTKNVGTLAMKTEPFGGSFLEVLEHVEEVEREGTELNEYWKTLYNKYLDRQELARPFLEKYSLQNDQAIRDASIRFILDNPDMNSVLITFRDYQSAEEYINLSGSRLTETDQAIMNFYLENFAALYCRHACGICESACPHHIPVNTIMRYNHYFMAQHRQKYGMQMYNELKGGTPDNLCATCQGYCEKACPYDVHIRGLLTMAHRNLSLNKIKYT